MILNQVSNRSHLPSIKTEDGVAILIVCVGDAPDPRLGIAFGIDFERRRRASAGDLEMDLIDFC